MLKGRLLLEWSVIALIAALVVSSAVYFGFTRRVDNLLYDSASVRRAAPASDKILIVAIDNESLAELGNWPWPRSIHSSMISRLAGAKVKTIAYDILFVESADTATDTALAQAMMRGTPVVLPVLYETPGKNGTSHDLYLPVTPVAKAAKGLGTVNLVFDEDGIVRRAQLETRTDTESIPHLMEMAYRSTTGTPSPAFTKLLAHSSKSSAADAGTVLIPFQPETAFRHVSFNKLLAGEVPGIFLRDKIILVGATAPGLRDRFPVPGPAGSSMSGIAIQANMLNGLLNSHFISAAPQWVGLVYSLVPIVILMLCFLKFRPNINLAISLALIVLVFAVSLVILASAGLWIPPGPALLGIALIYPLWGWRRLEALSSFVTSEAKSLKSEPALANEWISPASGLDSIAAEASELRNIIGTLRGVQRFLSDVVAGFPDAVCVVDHENKVSLANDAALDVLGSDIKGQSLSDLISRLNQSRDSKADELFLQDGRTFLIRRAPLTLDKSFRSGAIIRFADITRLKEADREREQVLEFLSHDMRAPQAAIISLLEMNRAQPSENNIWKRVSDYAQQTLKLADDFVQRARLVSVKELRDEVNLASLIAESIDICWPNAKQKHIKITATGLDQEAYVMGDASSLVRAFTNLIDNAIKYSPHDSNVQILLHEHPETGSLICTVSDQGPGIPPARLQDLFAAYGARGKQGVSGVGLGLAFVKSVVDHHKGTINCTSDSLAGTTFKVQFPILRSTETVV